MPRKAKVAESTAAATPSVVVAPVAPVVAETKPRAQSAWMQALKQWNASRGTYGIPKKGSKEYEEVKAIEAKLKGQ